MVKKLIKHEIDYYFRTLIIFLPMILVFGIVTAIVGLFEGKEIIDSIIYIIVVSSSMVMLYVSSIVCLVLTGILSVTRFYKNLFTQEGYLTLSLPITYKQHILVKLLVAIICEILTAVVVVVAWLIASISYPDIQYVFGEIFGSIGELIGLLDVGNIILYTIELIVMLFLTLISTNMLYYACITLGQTARKNRIFSAVGYYFLYYIIVQIISTFITVIITTLAVFDKFTVIIEFIENNPYLSVHIFFVSYILIAGALTYLYYRIILYVMNNRLNLE